MLRAAEDFLTDAQKAHIGAFKNKITRMQKMKCLTLKISWGGGPQTHVWFVSSGMGPLARCPLFFNIEGGNLIHQLVANIVCPLFGAGQAAHSWFFTALLLKTVALCVEWTRSVGRKTKTMTW